MSSLSSRSSSTAASQARSSARASSGQRPVSVWLERASPSRMRRWTIVKIAAGSGRGAVAGAAAERAGGERHRGVRPLRGAAVLAERRGRAAGDVVEEVAPRRAGRRLRERAADVDAGVVVGAADAGAAVGLDVDLGGRVELRRARAVARLPDREQLREAAAVARQQRRLDGVERVGERAGDLAPEKLFGDGLHVAGERLQTLVVVRGDAPDEDVHGLWLAAKPGGELLGDERVVVALGELERAVDRVVIGDRHEAHATALGEVVDLLRRRGAFRQPERALDAELGDRRGGRVAVQVDPAGRGGGHRCSLAWFDRSATTICPAFGGNW